MLRRYPDPLVDDHAMRAIRCSVRKAIHRGWFPRDEFEDLVQDAIVHLLGKIDCFDPCRASWATFCSMVVRSFLSRRYRSQCTQANVESLDDRPPGDQSGFDAGHVEEQHCVSKRFQRIRSEIEWLDLEDDISQMVAFRFAQIEYRRSWPMIRAATTYDFVLVGGGLQAGLLALAIDHYKPDAKVLILERDDRLFGNHTWSFHHSDIAREWIWLKTFPNGCQVDLRVAGFMLRLDTRLRSPHVLLMLLRQVRRDSPNQKWLSLPMITDFRETSRDF